MGLAALAACNTPDPALRLAAGKQAMCVACHGPDGNSVSARAPVLAGQQQAYIVAQLNAFRDHSRANADARAFMWPMAASLTDESIDTLATYFSALTPPALPSPSAVETTVGRSIYEQGAAERGIAPCGSCHGDKGQGLAIFPRLAGQHADYLAAQLAAFADGSRASPVMAAVAKNLSPDEAQRIAAYLAAL